MGCLYNHSLLYLNQMAVVEDTNAASESWNDIIKSDELKQKLPIRIGFITCQEEIKCKTINCNNTNKMI